MRKNDSTQTLRKNKIMDETAQKMNDALKKAGFNRRQVTVRHRRALYDDDYRIKVITNICSSQLPHFRHLSAFQLLSLYEIEMILISFYR